jgi:hypothetical protein
MELLHGIKLRHNNFYVFPTYEHQSSELSQPEYIIRFASMLHHNCLKEINTIDLIASYQDNIGEPIPSNDIFYQKQLQLMEVVGI